MDFKRVHSLMREYKRLSKNFIDVEKYSYYAITHHSTSIEGSTLKEKEVINLLEYGMGSKKPFEHQLMVSDHHKALMFVLETAKEKKPITVDFIQQINAKVMQNTGKTYFTALGDFDSSKGELRLFSVRAGNRTFPDYKKLPKLLKDFCEQTSQELKKARSTEKKLLLSFKAHFDLVSIHPFADGNGRTSRLLMNYIQAYFNLPLSIVFLENRMEYIEALEKSRKDDELTPLYEFMLRQYEKFLRKEIKLLKS